MYQIQTGYFYILPKHVFDTLKQKIFFSVDTITHGSIFGMIRYVTSYYLLFMSFIVRCVDINYISVVSNYVSVLLTMMVSKNLWIIISFESRDNDAAHVIAVLLL